MLYVLKKIKDNRIYKGFRWNFVVLVLSNCTIVYLIGAFEEYSLVGPTVEIVGSCPFFKIIETFYTKDFTAKHLNIGKTTMKDIIKNGTLYNNSYFVEIYKCSKELLESYDKPQLILNKFIL